VSSEPGISPASPSLHPDELKAVPVRHPGRWVAAAIVVVIAVSIVHSIVSDGNFGWGHVGHYLFSARITGGVLVTIELTLAAQGLGIALGVLLAVMRLSPNPLISGASWLYIWFFRGTPVYVQLIFWYVGIAALYPTIDLGVPFGPSFIHINANTAITPFLTVMLGLGLNEGAYMSEIVRAGIISVDEGQHEAALSLGMSRLRTMRRIVLPQAMRVIIPPMTSQYLNLAKNSSLAIAIGFQDVVSIANTTLNQTGQAIEGIAVIMAVYLTISLSISLFMNWYNAHIALVER
jgi:polar amino acid transport system permease protein